MLERYHRELLNFLTRQVNDRHAAADLAQESYVRVLTLQQGGQVVHDVRALLYRTARNLVIDRHRRQAVRQHDSLESLGEADQPWAASPWRPDAQCELSQEARACLQAIDTLPSRCREAFCLYVFEGLPNRDIAERLGVSLSMVNQYISRGKLACAQAVSPMPDNPGTPSA